MKYAILLCLALMCSATQAAEKEAWRNGPVPNATYGYGAVVLKYQTNPNRGFIFVEFKGDHFVQVGDYFDGVKWKNVHAKYFQATLESPRP
jgi:hypothetical protein